MRAEEIAMRIHSQWKKLFVVVPVLLAVFCLAATPTSRQRALSSNTPLFLPAVPYSSGGSGAHSTAAADLNGDGKVDLVVANYNSATVGVRLGNGDGTFQTVVNYGSGGDPFRYGLRPHRGYDPAAASRFATAMSQPLVASAHGQRSQMGLKLRIDQEDVLV
jgi:hypothetical protein